MSTIINLLIGFVATLVSVLAVVFAWNKVSDKSIADFGRGPLLPSVGGKGA